MKMASKKNVASFLLFIFLVIAIEWLGHLMTYSSVNDWYLTLRKPSWNPPPYVFGPVWTIIYLMIAVAGWRIYTKAPSSKQKKRALIFYGIQLLFNLSWSFFFFFLKSPILGLLDILALLIFIALTIKTFYPLDKIAALLLMPYFGWTMFASTLNVAIWSLNL